MTIINKITNRLISGCNVMNASINAGGPLRGEVGFERWYVHYHNKVNPQQIKEDPSMIFIPRIWALASIIESFVKTIIVGLSILYYAYQENRSEVEKRTNALCEQGNSLYYSSLALLSPSAAIKDFSVYRGNPSETLTRTSFFGVSLGQHSWGTIYTGKTTLNMLIHAC